MPRTSNPGHLTKLFSSAVLAAFLSDLKQWDSDERKEEIHAAICQWLEELTNVAATIPDGNLLGRKIHERCAAVAQAYLHWYESDDGLQRTRRLRKLRKCVNALATAYRVRTKLLEAEVDLAIPKAMYDATARLLIVLPDASSALGQVMHRFTRHILGAT